MSREKLLTMTMSITMPTLATMLPTTMILTTNTMLPSVQFRAIGICNGTVSDAAVAKQAGDRRNNMSTNQQSTSKSASCRKAVP